MQTLLDMIPKESAEYVEASRVIFDEGGNYISFHGKPYLLNGMQVRPDRVMEQFNVSTDEDFTEYVEPLFQQCAEMGYQTIIFPIRWNQIEIGQDEYNFVLLQRYYDYARKYDLTVHLLWFGSDTCGWSSNIPQYVKSNKETYSRLAKFPEVIDYGNVNLLEREIVAFQKVLQWLHENDRDCRTVAIQIENEPNCEAAGGAKRAADTDVKGIDESTWCSGQRREVYNLMNLLGMMVKRGPYRCVTRVNFITHPCWFNGIKNHELIEVANLDGIDMVGCDSYQADPDTFLLDILNFEGNIPHWPEYGSNHRNYVPAILNALSQRAGVFGYQLKATVNDRVGTIYTIENDWTWPEGDEMVNSTMHRADAYELRALNTILNKASQQIALNDVTKTHVFNLVRDTRCREFTEVDGVQIQFTNDGANDFGGCGYVTMISDKEMLVFATRGESKFHFSGKNLALVQVGFFADDVWFTRGTVPVLENTITVTHDMAMEGTLIRVTFN